MYLCYLAIITAVASTFPQSAAFLSPHSASFCQQRQLRVGINANAPPPNNDSWPQKNNIILLSLEGTLLSSTRSKSCRAIQAAFKVWPSLVATAQTLNLNPNTLEEESWNWLVEKLNALSSITQQGDTLDQMMGCDAVFLARVILEEQLLDGGRSNGRGGKYGGKYHPSWTSDFDSDGSMAGSRPLTVGELYANWEELREVVEFKFTFVDDEETGRKMNPIPRIKDALNELMLNRELDTQDTWHPFAYDVLMTNRGAGSNDARQNIILMLGHETQLPSTLNSLASMGIKCAIDVALEWDTPYLNKWLKTGEYENSGLRIVVTSSTKACSYHSNSKQENTDSIMILVPSTEREETQSEMIERIVIDFYKQPRTSSTFIRTDDEFEITAIHTSLDVLRRCKSFQRDSKRISLNLLMPTWADNIHPIELDESEADHSLRIVTESQFLNSILCKTWV